jgi:homoserine kinase
MTDVPVGRRASVAAPATSANLGPGFDALGLALALRDDVSVEVVDAGVSVAVDGEGADAVARDETNLVVRAVRIGLDALGVRAPGLRLVCRNRIPHGRGLGSSAAAIVGGLRLASALHGDGLDDGDLIALATDIEGHPDNVAACALGGLTIAYAAHARPRAVRLDVHPALSPVVFVPSAALSTEVARALLPAEVPHRDAVANSARSALLVAAMTAHTELLLDATEDRLHQAYRQPSMPESIDLITRLRDAGHAAVVSGAGPAVLVLATPSTPIDADAWAPTGWRAMRLSVDFGGAVATRLTASAARRE